MTIAQELEQLEAIEQAFLKASAGLSVRELKTRLAFDIPIYTLQRRLRKLMNQGKLRMEGTTKGAVYYLADQHLGTGDETVLSNSESGDHPSITLSDKSRTLLHIVSKPISSRKPVMYHPDFLEKYTPNDSSYLSRKEKEQLASIGQTPRPFEPAGTYARKIMNRLLIDLAWNSSRLEGNTYSLLDTDRLIHEGQQAENRSATETQMILNHKDAIEFLVESAGEIGFNRYTILNLHAILSTNLLSEPAASGRLRTHGVGIHGSVYTPPAIPQQINDWFNMVLEKAGQINDPFEQAFFIMVHIPYLQPFDDVNKRVSRLAANIPLNRHNLSPLSFIDVPADLYISGLMAVYELNEVELLKDVFLWAYQRSASRYAMIRQTVGEPDPFRMKYRQEIRETISTIVKEVLDRLSAADFIRTNSKRLPEIEQQSFINAVESELLAMHEGNFARYRVAQSQFDNWWSVWKRK